jgi:hypothetical protein
MACLFVCAIGQLIGFGFLPLKIQLKKKKQNQRAACGLDKKHDGKNYLKGRRRGRAKKTVQA